MSNTITSGALIQSLIPPTNFDDEDIINPPVNIVWRITKIEHTDDQYYVQNAAGQFITVSGPNITLEIPVPSIMREIWRLNWSTDPDNPGLIFHNLGEPTRYLKYNEGNNGWRPLTLAQAGDHSSIYRLGNPIQYERITNINDLVNGYYVVLAASTTSTTNANSTTISRSMDAFASTVFNGADVFYSTTSNEVKYASENFIWRIERTGTGPSASYTFFSVPRQQYIRFTGTATNEISLFANPTNNEEKFIMAPSSQGSTSGHSFFRVQNVAHNNRALLYNGTLTTPRFANYASATITANTNMADLAFFRMILPPPEITAVATPVITPSTSSPYHNPFTVTITCETDDAEIYYTTDGTDPSLPGATLYTVPINISAPTTTLRVIAKKADMDDSSPVTVTYNIVTAPPTLDIIGGIYYTPQTITITSPTNGGVIYYTLINETPNTLYTEPIIISETATLRTRAVHTTYLNSNETVATYTIIPPYEGTFTRITSIGELETGYYVVASTTNAMQNTINGSNNWFERSIIALTGPGNNDIVNPSNHLVWYIEKLSGADEGRYSIKSNYNDQFAGYQGTASQAFLYNAITGDAQKWTITVNANLFILTNVGFPTRILQYNNQSGSERFACYTSAQLRPALFKLQPPPPPDQVVTPTFTPSATSPFRNPFTVTISSITDDADIYPISISGTPTTLRAIAKKADMLDSEEMNATYTISIAPITLSHDAGVHDYPFSVTITCVTDSIDIFYTFINETPATPYTEPVFIDSNLTLRVRAEHRYPYNHRPIFHQLNSRRNF
jgi:hypothetical protein